MANEKIYLVDGARVSFIFDESGPHWQCSHCSGDCSHILTAAARMTLNSWALSEAPIESEVFAE